jgi:hypothetical protein
MAQDQSRKDDNFDLIAEFRRTIDTPGADSTASLPEGAVPPPPLPDLPALIELPPSLATGGAAAAAAAASAMPPALPMPLPPFLEAAAAPASVEPCLPEAPPAAAPAKGKAKSRAPSNGAAPAETQGDAAASAQPQLLPGLQGPAAQAKPGDRRPAKRRSAMPSRDQIAANDDAPSIGGLIYALNQKPSRKPFSIAAFASLGWAVVTLGFSAFFWGNEILAGAGLKAFLGRPELLTLVVTLIGPIALMFALAVISYRAEEMRLRSSAMTEVAVRLAEPDRMAEQSVASLGQAVRRQVSFMNDAVAQAIGRAGELEALVHNEVSNLERSYQDNEQKIRSLIKELSGERNELFTTSERVAGTLRSLGNDVPALIETLSNQQIKLAKIIEGAGQNLTQLETAIATQAGNLETVVGERTERLSTVLTDYTHALSSDLDQRMEAIGTTIATRTGDLQLVFEEYTRALDATLGQRADAFGTQLVEHTEAIDRSFGERTKQLGAQLDERMGSMQERLEIHTGSFIESAQALEHQLAERTKAIDSQLLERTQVLDEAFTERLRLFDDAILRSTTAIDQSVGEKTLALTTALDHHAKSLGETLSRQSLELDESLLQGINAVRRTSENITRQSIKALEGLAGQSELLKNVSENLLTQINTITNRFDNQSQQIVRAANALETANYKIDKTLQNRHAELSSTLDRMVGKAEELGQFSQDYTRQIEGSISEAEMRARSLTAELAQTTQERSRATLADIERLKSEATDTTTKALDDLRTRFSNVSDEVTTSVSSLSSALTDATNEARRRTAEAATQLAAEQERLRREADALPGTTRESADAMRRVLSDHLRAFDELSSLSRREAVGRDVTRPMAQPSAPPARPLIPVASAPLTPARDEQPPAPPKSFTSLTSALAQELNARPRAPSPAAATSVQGNGGDSREGWKLGDLLKRASADDDAAQQHLAQEHARQQAAAARGGLDFAVAARALDPATAAGIWQRLAAGQRGIMVRSIYTSEGRALFDETVQRLQHDATFADTTSQYLADFERVLQEADRQDPSGEAAQGHLRSDYGRVYLFLSHATGRIT